MHTNLALQAIIQFLYWDLNEKYSTDSYSKTTDIPAISRTLTHTEKRALDAKHHVKESVSNWYW